MFRSLALSLLCLGCVVDEPPERLTAAVKACGQRSGRRLFEVETFGGNGRTCASCHRSRSRTTSPEEAQTLFESSPDDPLFQGDAADRFGDDSPQVCMEVSADAACRVKKPGVRCRAVVEAGVTFECETSFQRFLAHATIRVGITPHADVLVDAASDTVFLNRGIPTSVNTPALDPLLMYDGRAPDLVEQARGALAGHAEVFDPCETDLARIAEFEQTEFSSPALEAFASGGPPPVLPEGNTEAERRGRTFFDPPAVPGRAGFCAICHSGPMLDTVSVDINLPNPEQLPGLTTVRGSRFMTAGVSERNALGNPVHLWTIRDGLLLRTIESPDIGRAAVTGVWKDVHQFKIPTLWGVGDRAPFFHDNSAKTIEELIDHYAVFIAPLMRGAVLSEQDQADIAAFLRLL